MAVAQLPQPQPVVEGQHELDELLERGERPCAKISRFLSASHLHQPKPLGDEVRERKELVVAVAELLSSTVVPAPVRQAQPTTEQPHTNKTGENSCRRVSNGRGAVVKAAA